MIARFGFACLFGLAVIVLLTRFTPVDQLAANAAGLACLTFVQHFFVAGRPGARNLMNFALVILMAYAANALVLAVLVHGVGAAIWLAQLAAIATYAGISLILSELFLVSDRGDQILYRFIAPWVDRPWLIRLGFIAALVPSLAYIAARTVFHRYDASDFRYFWLAGNLWRRGLDPYDIQLFTAYGAEVVNADDAIPPYWPYPPWTWVIARSAAMFPFAEAQVGWRLLLAAMMVGSILLLGSRISRGAAPGGMSPRAVWHCIAMLFFTCTMPASGSSLSLGQTSHLIFLGLMLALAAMLEERRWMGVAAMVLLAMKPQIGLIFGLFMLGTLNWTRPLVIAGTIVALLALPPIFVIGFEQTTGGFLNVLSNYASTPVDQAVGMTGLRHLAFELTGVELSAVAFALVGGVIALLVGYFLYRRATDATARGRILGLVLLIIMNFAPIHAYETIYVMPVILLMIGWPTLVQLCIGFDLLVVYRSVNIAGATGWMDPRTPYFYGTTIDSAGFLVLLLVWTAAMVHDHMAKRQANGTPLPRHATGR